MALTNLILTGGINHDYPDMASALSEVLAAADINSVIFEDIDAGFGELANQSFDLVTLFALRWRMLDDDKYIPHRDQWAYEISERDRANLLDHVNSGGGLFGLHTAAICFDTWDKFPDLLGAKWVWGETYHPPPEDILIQATGDHTIVSDLPDFTIFDEIYHNIAAADDAIPLLETNSGEAPGTKTLAWSHTFGNGRSIYHAPGHDRASITEPGHAEFLKRAARWCCGEIA